jgi:hypothetical protein
VETPLPNWLYGLQYPFAIDGAGRVYFKQPSAPGAKDVTLGILDRSSKQIATVVYAARPPTSMGSTFAPFEDVFGTAPDGGILALALADTGADVVRVKDTGEVTTVVHSELALSSVRRMRVHDGYLYVAGLGIWRTRERVF